MHSELAYLPSPTRSVLDLGPLPIHYYALCIVSGILAAILITDRRWRARGGGEHEVGDVSGWAVVFGILGGRVYHVITDPELYFTAGHKPLDALKIWDGGLGIWGAISLGALGAYIGCRRHGLKFSAFADAIAPGLLVAQAIGRLGNWFNNELYGRATTLPWKLQIHDIDVASGTAARDAQGHAIVLGYFQPTFLYELLWNLAVAAIIVVADRRYRLGRGNVFALYVAGYTVGRFWVELLRSDHANHIFGQRVNTWVSALLFVAAVGWFVRHRHTPRTTARPDDDGTDHGPDGGPDRAAEVDEAGLTGPDPGVGAAADAGVGAADAGVGAADADPVPAVKPTAP